MQAFSVNKDLFALILDGDTETPETVDGGKTIRAPQEPGDLCSSLRQGAEHDRPVGDGFISGDGNFSV